MNIVQVEERVRQMVENLSKEEFVFDLLLAYGLPKSTITLLKKGQHNLSKQQDQVILKNKIFFQKVNDADLHETIDSIYKNLATKRHNPRFLVVTDYVTLLAIDTKTDDRLDIPIKSIVNHYDFFLPWAGIEKHRHINENPADRKAAEKMARLYDEILNENKIDNFEKVHALNVFLSRILFCFFAEDTNIFLDKLFTDSVSSHTQADGSDFGIYLDQLFEVLNSLDRSGLPQYLQKFPYVNGGLFAKKLWIPTFTAKSRRIIVECGELDWSKINPDIFGSMMQAVVHPNERASLGMHYTSVPNIIKVIEPLFLNDLKNELELSIGNKNKLQSLLARISNIKFFDPACGSGNFLIVTYKEIRRLEMKILKELKSVAYLPSRLKKFYGIEIDDFAHEITKLSLYFAEHQMNVEFKHEFGVINPTLPLKTGGNIVCGNADRIDWSEVCSNNEGDEVYIFGNPPYLGARNQNPEQKEDMKLSIGHIRGFNNLDYVASWFYKASRYIVGKNAQFSFVSTNSICQGSQVPIIWPYILDGNLEIGFAYQSFKWKNNAKKNAGVICIIVGIRNCIKGIKKLLIDGNSSKLVDHINAYLLNADDLYINERKNPISDIPEMCFGSMPNDGGHLLINENDHLKLLTENPGVLKYIKRIFGAQEFLKGIIRYSIWIEDTELEKAMEIPFIKNRIIAVEKYRNGSRRVATNKLSVIPYRFGEVRHKNSNSIIIPRVSSERREYIPFGFLDKDSIITDSAQAIYDADPWIFGVISSRMHMTWVRAVAGRLKTDYRYSSALCYNTFPIPTLTSKQKEDIKRYVYRLLEERERFSEKTITQLYDPQKMPIDLKEAHHSLDLVVDRCYRSKAFTSDDERLEYLFRLYKQMIKEEKFHDNAI